MFPDAFFAAVHHKGSELECSCLKSGAFNQSMLGANVQCNQVLNVCVHLKKGKSVMVNLRIRKPTYYPWYGEVYSWKIFHAFVLHC